MKLLITSLALLASATTAQAQSITAIARYPAETISLSDLPCQETPSMKTAIHIPYRGEPGASYGCWTTSGGVVMIHWYQVANRRALPESVPKLDFERVSN